MSFLNGYPTVVVLYIPSPCSTSVTIDGVSTDRVASAPELVVEMLSEWLVGHSACRGGKKGIYFGCVSINMYCDLPTLISVGKDVPALFPAVILTRRLHMSTLWGSLILMATWDPD